MKVHLLYGFIKVLKRIWYSWHQIWKIKGSAFMEMIKILLLHLLEGLRLNLHFLFTGLEKLRARLCILLLLLLY